MSILKYPLATEKGIKAIEAENVIVFVVDKAATKDQIKVAVEKMLNAKVAKVNTHNYPNGEKRAYVKFVGPAIDIATQLGML